MTETIRTDDEITCLKYHQNGLYFAQNNQLFVRDLRTNSTRLVYTAEDDINAIDIHSNNKFIGLVDDSGFPTVLDITTSKPYKKFKSSHSNLATVFKFRPTLPWQTITAGLDSSLKSWDFSKGLLKSTHEFQSGGINPPFVYCLDITSNGNCMAAGLGDGTISVLKNVPRKFDLESSIFETLELHSWSVSGL